MVVVRMSSVIHLPRSAIPTALHRIFRDIKSIIANHHIQFWVVMKQRRSVIPVLKTRTVTVKSVIQTITSVSTATMTEYAPPRSVKRRMGYA
jgi:Holliday junction resolvasome RuvABC endonuclease subunit